MLAEVSAAVVGSAFLGEAKPDLKNYRLDGNTYYSNGRERPFRYGGRADNEDDMLDFTGRQALGLDVNGQFLAGKDGRPVGTRAFVFPNALENGRAHVGIFNWDGLDEVEVDFAQVLTKGRRVAVYNVLDITGCIGAAKPVMTFTYNGEPIALPMRRDTSSPDFDAYLVLPVE